MDDARVEKGEKRDGEVITSEKVVGLADAHIHDSIKYWRGEMRRDPTVAAEAIRGWEESLTKLTTGEMGWNSVQRLAIWGATREDTNRLIVDGFLYDTYKIGVPVTESIKEKIEKTSAAIMGCQPPAGPKRYGS